MNIRQSNMQRNVGTTAPMHVCHSALIVMHPLSCQSAQVCSEHVGVKPHSLLVCVLSGNLAGNLQPRLDVAMHAGSAITGPVAKECADLWPRIASAANSIV